MISTIEKYINYLEHMHLPKWTDWKTIVAIWPRKVDGKWRWLSKVERRFSYIPYFSILGSTLGSAVEYRINSSKY